MKSALITIFVLFIFIPQAWSLPGHNVLIDIEHRASPNASWLSSAKTDEDRIRFLLEELLKTATGKGLISRARNKAMQTGHTLFDIILVGEVSITDTTLVRRFVPSSPENVVFDVRSKIYINRDHKISDAVLDLAHELTHFVEKSGFNPYSPSFSAKDFIVSTVEGKGGEVDAYLTECQVQRELYGQRHQTHSNCERIQDEDGNLVRKKAVALFYQLGPFYSAFLSEVAPYRLVRADFGDLSRRNTEFISSAYGLPYPLAALREFASIQERVCANDQKRLGLMRESLGRFPAQEHESNGSASDDRDPASLKSTRNKEWFSMNQSFEKRCKTTSSSLSKVLKK